MAAIREIQVRDEVKHLYQDAAGVVLAKHPGYVEQGQDPNKQYLDVLVQDGYKKVYYDTPAENWETTVKVEDLE